VKKIILLLIVALMALAVAGCTSPSATPTGHPTDTTPGTLPTQTPATATPGPTSFLSGYTKYVNGGTQPFVNQVTCTFEAVYNNSDWSMPHALQTQFGHADHGAIYQLLYYNPTDSNQTIAAGYDVKSHVEYYGNGIRGLIPTSDIYYDPITNTEFGTVTLKPGESRELYMLAYITNNSEYVAHKGTIERPSLDVHPQYWLGPH
jgi:hypothetical protein